MYLFRFWEIGKALCEVWAVADAIPQFMAALRVDCKLSRRDFVQLSPQRSDSRT